MSDQGAVKSDALKYLPVKVFPALSGLLTIYFLTRSLDTADYATYSFLLAAILLFIQLSAGWINSAVIYFYPEAINNKQEPQLEGNIILLQLYLFSIAAIGFFLVCFFGNIPFRLIGVGLMVMFGQIFINLMYSFLQAKREIFNQIVATTIQSCLQVIFIFGCYYYFPQNLTLIIWAIALSYLAALAFLVLKIKVLKTSFRPQKGMDIALSKKILRYGIPICIWFFASQFYTIGDRILLKYMDIEKDVANYTSFRDLAVGLSGFLTMPLLLAAHPVIMNLWKTGNNKADIEQLMSQNIRILILFLTTSCLIMLTSGEWIMTAVVSANYVLATPYMCIILVSIFIGAIGMYIHKALEVSNKTFLMGKIAICIAFMSGLANIFLLPLYGVFGAILVNLSCQIAYLIVVYYFSRSILKPHIELSFMMWVFLWAIAVLGLDQLFMLLFITHYSATFRFLYVSLICIYMLYKSADIRAIFEPVIKKFS